MNLNNLIEDVGALGFESELEADIPFISFANRALYTIFTERGEEKQTSVFAIAKSPLIYIKELTHAGVEPTRVDTLGVSYSFKVCGCGHFTVCDENGEKSVHFDSPYQIFKGYLYGKSYIVFGGEYSYTIHDFACYRSLYGKSISDIPVFSREITYDLKAYAPDFLSPSKEPCDGRGERIPGAKIESDKLILPYGYTGEVIVYYKRTPKKITKDSDEIDIPNDCKHLLTLLTASYLWLDDDADKAQYYMGLYRDGMDRLLRKVSSGIETEYKDVLRWT